MFQFLEDRQTDRPSDRPTERQTERQTDRQTDPQTDRQTDLGIKAPSWSLKLPQRRDNAGNVHIVFKLRLGALIPRSVSLSVCLSVGPSYKNYKTLQNITNH